MEKNRLITIIGPTPMGASIFLESLKYDYEKYKLHGHKDNLSDVHFRSPFEVAEERCAVCCEAAAAIGYTFNEQYNPRYISLLASEKANNPGHAILAFQDISSKKWGSLGHSSKESQKNRSPIYNTLKDLITSYITGEITYAGAIIKKMLAFPQDWAQRPLSMEEFKNASQNKNAPDRI